jgi:hypothetical protein
MDISAAPSYRGYRYPAQIIAQAAKRFFRKLLKGLRYVPRAIVTDKLASYRAAKQDVMPTVAHQRGPRMNNRGENSHQPTRERERAMRCFKSIRHAPALPFCACSGLESLSTGTTPDAGMQLSDVDG